MRVAASILVPWCSPYFLLIEPQQAPIRNVGEAREDRNDDKKLHLCSIRTAQRGQRRCVVRATEGVKCVR